MKRIPCFLTLAAIITSCQNNNSLDQVVSQKFVHKYGFETTEEDWKAREKDGQVVTVLKNGVKITASYENGKLHGPTTHTFPNSSIVEKQYVYSQGTLLKESINDITGMPIKEEIYEYDQKKIVTLWDEKGVPLSVEEYEGSLLMDGKYFTPEHELEASVENGAGRRIKRDRSGLLISSDEIVDGIMYSRTTFHPNGNIHTISHYHNYQLHGEQQKFTASGKPLMSLNWEHGTLHGDKVIYRNGLKVAVIPYVNGIKNGIELHFDDLGNLTAEIEWRKDKKHGTTKMHTEDFTDTEWFFNGQSVSAEKFKILETREQISQDFKENVAR
jgi:antitoxin component YwqK of YwqJK toxin-antitoxin module